ncbi:methyltransferase [Durotheca rogersii]|uniref:methyltransferase n=1 Tax=Durotheca rogersii TaxID=419775 RepID=UPI00221E6DED|nr:methyltransferase [Durotheca rogersii]KAI5855021.1 methyltransferase [Durotheca rogersii]
MEHAHEDAPRRFEDTPHTKVYTKRFLTSVYDVYVLWFNMSALWRCPTRSVLLPFFKENFSQRHLDCGVGTGWFPATALRCLSGDDTKQELTLVDLSQTALEFVKDRILSGASNTTVKCVAADVLESLPETLRAEKFDTVTMFNLLHCVPGQSKFGVFRVFKTLLAEGGVLAGCSILGHNTRFPNFLSRWCMAGLNHWGIFNNWDDTEDDFRRALEAEFEDVEIRIVGMMILFRAKTPRVDTRKPSENDK